MAAMPGLESAGDAGAPPAGHSLETMPDPTGVNARLAALIGQVVLLMANSPEHRYLHMQDIDWAVLPPLLLDQFRLYRDAEEKPVAFVAWAYLSAEVEERLVAGANRLSPQEWRCGDRLWVVEIVAPGGNAAEVMEDIRATAVPGTEMRVLRRLPGSTSVEVLRGPGGA